MIFSVDRVLSFVSQALTLEPGDLLLTGTPEGVGPLAPSDRLTIEIDGIGSLHANVAASAEGAASAP
jgi:2-keto-4-pentenoate hydratase/2-oxohepta-3-ene-1,7-dioic acid hydratase in catechol pathway